tara:strand:- start:497 stop:1582 length:1086 start_codon:yes stop_codon:yes gene_type:complete
MAETPQGNPFDPGVFNFASIMEDFYSSSGEDASEDERLQKAAFQGNLVQTGFDAMLASSLAEQNSAIAQENMTTQAMLEKSNAQDLMTSEFGFNELSKESNFKYENNFANAQYDRDVGMLAATGQQQRDNIREQSDQDRLTNIVQGEQQRLTDAQNIASQEKIAEGRYASDSYQADRAAEASMFGAQASADASRDVAETQKESAETTTGLRTAADENIAKTGAKASMYGSREAAEAQKQVARTQANAQTTVAGTQRKSALETTGLRTGADKDIARTQRRSAAETTDRASLAEERKAASAERASKFGSTAQLEGVRDTNRTTIENTRTTGDETRSTLEKENRLKARDRADMSRYSRGLARAN